MVGIIIDVVIGVVILVAVIVGLARGFCKQFSRPLVGLISIISAIALVSIIYPLIVSTGVLNVAMKWVAGWFKPEFYSVQIDSVETLQATIADNYLRILSGSAKGIFARMEGMLLGTDLEMTIANFIGALLVNVVCEFILWIIFYLAIKYLLFGIKYLVGKITKVVVFKSIDKILGLVWSLLLTYIIVVGLILTTGEITLVKFFPKATDKVIPFMNKSVLLSFLHSTNVLGSFIANIFGVKLFALA